MLATARKTLALLIVASAVLTAAGAGAQTKYRKLTRASARQVRAAERYAASQLGVSKTVLRQMCSQMIASQVHPRHGSSILMPWVFGQARRATVDAIAKQALTTGVGQRDKVTKPALERALQTVVATTSRQSTARALAAGGGSLDVLFRLGRGKTKEAKAFLQSVDLFSGPDAVRALQQTTKLAHLLNIVGLLPPDSANRAK